MISKDMVPSAASEQLVGVVETYIMDSSCAESDKNEVARKRISNMEYLNNFIWAQIRTVTI